jgi:hypothetical protein
VDEQVGAGRDAAVGQGRVDVAGEPGAFELAAGVVVEHDQVDGQFADGGDDVACDRVDERIERHGEHGQHR